MRKQYHSRYSERGCLIWDVHRLAKLSAGMSRIEVPLSEISELNETYWFQDENTLPTCRAIAEHARLINDTDLGYPIILSANGRVMDGMHRVAKAWMKGLHMIEAVQFTEDPEPDFIDVDLNSLPYDDDA